MMDAIHTHFAPTPFFFVVSSSEGLTHARTRAAGTHSIITPPAHDDLLWVVEMHGNLSKRKRGEPGKKATALLAPLALHGMAEEWKIEWGRKRG
jgi:hypothetical protein